MAEPRIIPRTTPLPQPPRRQEDVLAWAAALTVALQNMHRVLTSLPRSAVYTPTNVTTDRAYDANATTLDEVADVLGTLIADLQRLGPIG